VLNGSGAYLTEPAYVGAPPQVTPGQPFDWSGTLTFETSAALDGTYISFPQAGYGQVTSFTLVTNKISYDLKNNGTSSAQIPPFVVLAGGEVTQLGFRYESFPDIFVRIDGMNARYSNILFDGFHSAATGTLTPVAAVPEPETYALLLAGLGAIAGQVRRKSTRRRT
jgi:hypothetical protein